MQPPNTELNNGKPESDANEIERKDLLKLLKIAGSTLNYRINQCGFPMPIRLEGRKQWFCVDEVDAWRRKDS